MCPKLALLATVLALGAGPALADAKPPPSKPAASAAKPPAPVKATPAERAEADRLDALGRAAFWARQVDIDPADVDAGVKLARALRELGRYGEALHAADSALVAQPNNVEALLELARDCIAGNQGFYGIDPAKRAEALAPHDWRPAALLGVALEQASRDDEALAAHLKALQLAPDNPATLTNLGLFYATHGQLDKAEPLLRRAAAAPGATVHMRENLALVLGMQGRYDEAERIERQDLPPDVVQNNLAYLHAAASPAPARTWDALKSP